MVRVIANGPGWVIPKTQKIILQVWVEQSRKRSSNLSSVVAIKKGALGSPLTTVDQLYVYIYIYIYIYINIHSYTYTYIHTHSCSQRILCLH